MSALGHYLEEEGIATVAIALIRPQAVNTKPPRALWVPFELGRPFGPPSDAAFQKRVLLAALHMLVEGGRPGRIVRRTERAAQLERDPQGSRRPGVFALRPNEADRNRRNALLLDVVPERAHGARAERSNGRKDDGLDSIGL